MDQISFTPLRDNGEYSFCEHRFSDDAFSYKGIVVPHHLVRNRLEFHVLFSNKRLFLREVNANLVLEEKDLTLETMFLALISDRHSPFWIHDSANVILDTVVDCTDGGYFILYCTICPTDFSEIKFVSGSSLLKISFPKIYNEESRQWIQEVKFFQFPNLGEVWDS